MPPRPDDIYYALETMKMLREPDRRIHTFAETRFEFILLSEHMDNVDVIHIRRGEVYAMQPKILRPEAYREFELDGFEVADQSKLKRLIEEMREQGINLSFLQYGFQFSRGEVEFEVVHSNIQEVRERMLQQIKRDGNPTLALLEGADQAWEMCVLRFTMEMMVRSHDINAFDLKRRGLL